MHILFNCNFYSEREMVKLAALIFFCNPIDWRDELKRRRRSYSERITQSKPLQRFLILKQNKMDESQAKKLYRPNKLDLEIAHMARRFDELR